MKLQIKKILFIFTFILMIQNSAFAGTLTVQNFSSPMKIANKISQSINISFASEGGWRLFVEALDNKVVNQDHP